MRVEARLVVNAAGLGAQAVARRSKVCGIKIPPCTSPRETTSVSGRAPFSHLVYPMPTAGGLGVHATLDLGGRGRFGPDVEWVETLDYEPEPRARSVLRRDPHYWPGLPDDALQPGYAGSGRRSPARADRPPIS